jgi:hypothetical protein
MGGAVFTRSCVICGVSFKAARQHTRYCGPNCRKKAQRIPDRDKANLRSNTGVRAQKEITEVVAAKKGGKRKPSRGLITAIREELTAAGREDSVLGIQAVELAKRLCDMESGTGLAALSKELRLVLAEALGDTKAEVDPLDELKSRREVKLRGA